MHHNTISELKNLQWNDSTWEENQWKGEDWQLNWPVCMCLPRCCALDYVMLPWPLTPSCKYWYFYVSSNTPVSQL
jgi:hypothetical protein